jgi:hypothetical protein
MLHVIVALFLCPYNFLDILHPKKLTNPSFPVDLTRYTGRWYEIATSKLSLDVFGARLQLCPSIYTLNETNASSLVKIFASGWSLFIWQMELLYQQMILKDPLILVSFGTPDIRCKGRIILS